MYSNIGQHYRKWIGPESMGSSNTEMYKEQSYDGKKDRKRSFT
jgi:hypothetical protein